MVTEYEEMDLLILPVMVFCLCMAVVVWTTISVLKHGFTLKCVDKATGICYTKASRIAMWWLFICSAFFLIGFATGNEKFFVVAIVVIFIGAFVVGGIISKTASPSHEEMQSCLSLKITSVAAMSAGVSMIVLPIIAFLFADPESDPRLVEIAEVLAFSVPFGSWLIIQSVRIWKKAVYKEERDQESPLYGVPGWGPRARDDEEMEWWISRKMRGKSSRRTALEPCDSQPTEDRPHLVTVVKRR